MHHGTSGDSWDTCPLCCWGWARRQLGKLAHLKYNMGFLESLCTHAYTHTHRRLCCAEEQQDVALSKPHYWSVLEQVIECWTSYGAPGSWPVPTSCCREDGTRGVRKVGFRQKLCCSCRDRYSITPPERTKPKQNKSVVLNLDLPPLQLFPSGVSWELNKPEVCRLCL